MNEDQQPDAATTEDVAHSPVPADDGPQSAEDAVLEALGEADEGVSPGETAGGDAPSATAPGSQKDSGAETAANRPEDGSPTGAAPKPDAPSAPAADPEAMPDGLSDKAKERFQSLAGERDQWRERANQWQQTIESTGASPQQFGELLEYTRLLNSGRPDDARSALKMARDAVRDLSMALGEDSQAVDVLEPYPDLLQRVGDGDLDRKTALELARGRQQSAAAAQQQQATAASQAEEAAIQQATGQLDTLGQQLRARDPDFERKFEALKPFVPVIAENAPPTEWAQRFLAAYQQVQLPPEPQRLRPSPQPLRTTGAGSTTVHQQPQSALEAVTAALGM